MVLLPLENEGWVLAANLAVWAIFVLDHVPRWLCRRIGGRAHHPGQAAFARPQDHSLHVLAVHPDRRSQGVAHRLLEPKLRQLDRDGEGAHLESSNGRNLSFYWRCGFELLAEVHRPEAGNAALFADLGYRQDEVPQPGDTAIVLDGSAHPVCVIRTLDLEVVPFHAVDETFAWEEGEGDRSLRYWMAEHERSFRHRCVELGITFGADLDVVLES